MLGAMSSTTVATYVHARDPISQAGVVAQLRMRPEIRVVETAPQSAVAVMIADSVDETTTRELRAMRKDGQPRLMLVATTVDDAALVAAAEAGVAGLLRRCDASADMLVRTIVKVASGEGEVPPDLLGRLLEQVGRLQRQVLAPRGLTFTGLTPRETEVLRLVAEGPRHRRDSASDVLQRAHREECAARSHHPAAVAQSDACGRLRRTRRLDLIGRSPLGRPFG